MRHALACRCGHTDTHRDRQRLAALDIADLAGRGEDLLADVDAVLERALRQQHREAVAADSARESAAPCRATDHLGDALDHFVAGAEAERFVDRLQPIDVDIEQRVRGRRVVEQPLRAAFEYQAIHEAGQRIVFAAQDSDRLATHELQYPDVAQFEVFGFRRPKQRNEPGHAIVCVADRTGQDLVGRGVGGTRDAIYDHGSIVELHPRE